MSTRVPTQEEEVYFQKQELARRKQLRDALSEAAGELRAGQLSSTEVTARVRRLGFVGDNARVFDLLPLVHVAWADGSISRKERASILKLVEARGFGPGSEPFRLFEALLEERPSDAFLEESMAVLRDVVPEPEHAREVVGFCVAVARARGGLLGLGLGGTVSDEGRARIEQIAASLGEHALEQVKRELA